MVQYQVDRKILDASQTHRIDDKRPPLFKSWLRHLMTSRLHPFWHYGVFIIYVRGAGKIRGEGGGASNFCVAQKGVGVCNFF